MRSGVSWRNRRPWSLRPWNRRLLGRPCLETLHDHIDLHAVGDLTPDDYWVRGSTALLDAVGSTIDRVVAMQRHTAAPYRADERAIRAAECLCC
ncbi:hypothetical protein EMO92_04220 [Bifidobacterium reuteri]|uniref:Uncharacterized protein n=1 Tax=Bifidobacterium reuteri TaxID=983706 RepID=A0A5J5E8Z4_9BIFI|nr:hypothetical protein [Bifidobacterium reuteri]KAA8825959.1 hypothetical protein EMO92_04220 [Bifidobacterium reuteri]